ncbi:ATP phosphoribosyltransferase catalytic subunit [Lentibacillus halodurans]|uniref:ATP phosphoribosyltransferase n=1 Tax=Lentibacillus halodurans TaxID=237679 RepID=A0A1I0XW06_9BACI|nr:ATP phosphoribosyltransferase [Lentibacillus halodurans]SFB05084.1 ATP phosphoribosyltransferase catalytic subunit [Lentibacillus halodurans]
MEFITLALAKGRTAKESINLLAKTGIYFADVSNDSRKLVFHDSVNKVKLIFVKAVDVPTYVEKGAADLGIVGKDNIMEARADVYEILDLKLGQCKFAVAGFNGDPLTKKKVLKVASKYPTVAKNHFNQKGIPIDTIKLNGSVELAPIIGLADVIVDIVESGNTIRENGLSILEELDSISTRLIVNKASFTTKSERVHALIHTLQTGLE